MQSLHRSGTTIAEPGPRWIILARVCLHNWRGNSESFKLSAFSCPVTDELLSASLRARTIPTDVFECFFHPLAALKLAATVILPAFGMKEIQLLHCHSIPDPNLVRGKLVPTIPEMS